MQGGQTRDHVVLRMTLAVACAALMAMIAAPAALASAPATDQYGSALPGGGNGGDTSGSSPSGGSETTIPVTGDSSPSTQQGGSGDSGGTNAGSTGTGAKGGSSDHGQKANAHAGARKAGDPQGSESVQNTSHSVPQIAADSADDSWLPFFIGGLVALACAAAALVFFRNRRRTAQG